MLGAIADREDVLGSVLRFVGRVVDVLVGGGIKLSFGLVKALVSSSVGAITGTLVGAIVGPGPMLGALSQTAKDKVAPKLAEPAAPTAPATDD